MAPPGAGSTPPSSPGHPAPRAAPAPRPAGLRGTLAGSLGHRIAAPAPQRVPIVPPPVAGPPTLHPGPARSLAAPSVPGLTDLAIIGRGSFSHVYRARQAAFDRIVALKVLEADVSSPAARATFEQECSATGRLSEHPNIVALHGSGVTADRRPYLVMAFYSGGSLAAHLTSSGPLQLQAVLRIGVKMAGALDAAHRSGVLHRDIKPGNILLSRYAEPVLGDFGIAALGATVAPTLMTPNFAAPEVLRGAPASTVSDVYSLAATLYMLLVGAPPFSLGTGEAHEAMGERMVLGPLPMVSHAQVDAETEAAILWGLVPDPANRVASALHFGAGLQEQQRRLGLPITELTRAR